MGRDVCKFRANWEKRQQWLIATYPAKHIQIDDYPIVKDHLLNFGQDRLEQSGAILKNGQRARKKTPHAWFELQDTCAYYEEFDKEKILYAEIVQKPRFYLDSGVYTPEASAFMMCGENLLFLIGILQSKLFTYLFRNFYAGGGLGGTGYRYKKQFILEVPIPPIDNESSQTAKLIERSVQEIINFVDLGKRKHAQQAELQLNEYVNQYYCLSKPEKLLASKVW